MATVKQSDRVRNEHTRKKMMDLAVQTLITECDLSRDQAACVVMFVAGGFIPYVKMNFEGDHHD